MKKKKKKKKRNIAPKLIEQGRKIVEVEIGEFVAASSLVFAVIGGGEHVSW